MTTYPVNINNFTMKSTRPESFTTPTRTKDVLGKLKVSMSQNIYEADFEYGTQPMRWENFTANTATSGSFANVAHFPGMGGVRMLVGNNAGDLTIRQSRPYHRYQPGKTMFMATAINFGTSTPSSTTGAVFVGSISGTTLTVTSVTTGTIAIGQVINGTDAFGNYVPGNVTIVSGSGLSWTLSVQSTTNISSTTLNAVVPGNFQRVGFFDDGNGVFFEQGIATTANPSGMYAVIRSDAGSVNYTTGTTTSSLPVDYKFSLENWRGDPVTSLINWNGIQMFWLEYAWYGAGAIRWGCLLNGEPYVLHEVGTGNGNYQGPQSQSAWSRTGNLPVRYEQRNMTATTANSSLVHFGVSVMVENRQDPQRGFTYSYGMAANTTSAPRRNVPSSNTRFPVVSVQMRNMGTIEYSANSTQVGNLTFANTTCIRMNDTTATAWIPNQFVGRGLTIKDGSVTTTARIVNNTVNAAFFTTVTSSNTTTPIATAPALTSSYQIGLINRGQILPQTLILSSDALCVVEMIVSTASSPVTFTGAKFEPMSTLGSINSLATRDVSATAMTTGAATFTATISGTALTVVAVLTGALAIGQTVTGPGIPAGTTLASGSGTSWGLNQSATVAGTVTLASSAGEVVYAFTAPSGGSGLQTFDLSNLFALYNNIQGNTPDTLTVAVTTTGASANVGAHMIAQEAMS